MADSNEEIMDATAEMIDTAAAVPPVADMPEGTEAPAPADAGLSINDIQGCVTIIDLVTKRGAFEGPELADVGAVRNRLDAFLKAAAAAQAPAEGAAETPAE
mgnify:FL=1|jgi:hypothetical protein|tara:strand:+ start:644 stop:949 length:306 start_codon:yes stop_codon:yes gene_type:complete